MPRTDARCRGAAPRSVSCPGRDRLPTPVTSRAAEVTFLKSFGGNGFRVAEVEEGDISRIAELVEQYVGLPLGIVDAAVMAVAERLNLAEVATVDRKHFSIVRPRHVSAFRLLPEAL